MTDTPHLIQRQEGGPLEPASTAEIAPLVAQHAMHDGIAYFPNCPHCIARRDAGEYPHWFPEKP